jgi:antitoxin HicB
MTAAADTTIRYSIVIEWSDEDQTYVVILPEWEGRYVMPVASGKTYSEALDRGVNALKHMVEVATKDGEPVPPPRTFTAA